MNRKTVIILVAVFVFIALLFAITIGVAMMISHEGSFTGNNVGLIRIEGVITSGKGSSGILSEGSAGAERIVELLEDFRKDGSARSLVIRINSPGGSAAGSQEIYQEIMRVRRGGKKVVISMGDVAASGGYYIASAADKIYANPATLTGSIGVIMEAADIHELLNRLGIEFNPIKSGKHKDMGSFSRPMTAEERKILQGLIDDVFDQFVTDVSKGRKLPKKEVHRLADGRVYTGRQALKLKLVDKNGSLEDALRAAAREVGIKGKFNVKEYERKTGLLNILLGPTDTKALGRIIQNESLRDIARALLQMDSRLGVQ